MPSGNKGGSNYDPSQLGNQLGNKLTSYVNTKAPVYNQPTYPGLSDTTKGGLADLLGTADNATYTGGLGKAMDYYSKAAAGDFLGGQDEYFKRNLDRTLSDTKADVLSSLGGSGDLNSDLHIKTLTDALGGVRDNAYTTEMARERGEQTQALGLLPGIYQAEQDPAKTKLTAGAITDADRQATRTSDQDLFDRTNNSDYNRFLQLLQGFSGTQQNAGMQQETPWWQSALGTGIGLAGLFL